MATATKRVGHSGYRPAHSPGGSKKGRRTINWRSGVGAMYKIAIQMLIEKRDSNPAWSRDFGGAKALEPVLLFMREKHPEFYEQLRTSRCPQYPPRTTEEMCGVLYDRGHKGFYRNDAPREVTGRPVVSKEHYTQSKALMPHVQEALRVLAPVLHLSRKS